MIDALRDHASRLTCRFLGHNWASINTTMQICQNRACAGRSGAVRYRLPPAGQIR